MALLLLLILLFEFNLYCFFGKKIILPCKKKKKEKKFVDNEEVMKKKTRTKSAEGIDWMRPGTPTRRQDQSSGRARTSRRRNPPGQGDPNPAPPLRTRSGQST